MTWFVIWILSRIVPVGDQHLDDFGRTVYNNEFILVERHDTLSRAFKDRQEAAAFYQRATANLGASDGSTAEIIIFVGLDSIP